MEKIKPNDEKVDFQMIMEKFGIHNVEVFAKYLKEVWFVI